MATHSYVIEADSAAPIETVFDVLVDAPGWTRWVRMVSRGSYAREGVPAPHGVGAVRDLGARIGPRSLEEVIEFERPITYAYRIVSGPLPITGYVARVTLSQTPSGTHIHWTGTFSSAVPGMAGFLRRTVRGFAAGLVRESQRRAASS
jgi:hypothetical protein